MNYLDVREEFRGMNIYIGHKNDRLDYVLSKVFINSVRDSAKIYGNQIYWKHDYHFNNIGYMLFAKAVFPKVNKLINDTN